VAGPVSLFFAAILASAGIDFPFQTPLRVSDGTGASAAASLDVDAMDSPLITYSTERGVILTGGFNRFGTSIPVGRAIAGAKAPSIVATPIGTCWIAFEAPDANTAKTEVYLAGNPGGSFLDPEYVGEGARPVVWISDQGDALIAREVDGESGREVVVTVGAVTEVARFPGQEPSLIAGGDGRIHVAWIRDGDLFVAEGAPPDLDVRRWTETAEEEADPEIALLTDHDAAVLYRVGGEFFLRTASSIEAIRIISDVEAPGGASLDMTRGGVVFAAIADGPDVLLVTGTPGFLEGPSRIAGAETPVSDPRIRIDGRGVAHLAYTAGGEIWYTNDSPRPRPDFTAEPREGEPPLSVQFSDRSAGDVRGWSWDFGDGQTSARADPVHIYAQPGAYTVRLTVRGAAGEKESLTRDSAVVVREPSNYIIVPDLVLFPGLTGTYVPVLGTHADPIQGLQLSLRYDPTLLRVNDVLIERTTPEAYQPEFFVPRIYADEGEITVGLYLDVSPPFDGRTIPPGIRQRLVNLLVDVPGDTPADIETEIVPRDGSGTPPIRNIFTVDGYTLFPVLVGGRMRIIPFVAPFPRLFIRGDVDANGTVVLSDPIWILNYIFAGGKPPACMDAADIDDNGWIDIADPIVLLEYLYAFGRAPEVPFPSYGFDATPDTLPDC